MTNRKYSTELYRLWNYYSLFKKILEIYFSGLLTLPEENLNYHYLRICNKIEEILDSPGFEDLKAKDWRVINDLRTLDEEVPESEWEFGGKQSCYSFLSEVETLFIKNGEKTYELKEEDLLLISSVNLLLEEYSKVKSTYEKNWKKKNAKEESKSNETLRNTLQLRTTKYSNQRILNKDIKTNPPELSTINFNDSAAIIIGINDYSDVEGVNNLNGVQDAKKLVNLCLKYNMKAENITILIDKSERANFLMEYPLPVTVKSPNKKNILNSFQKFKLNTYDTIIVYFAGHGKYDDIQKIDYLIPDDGDIKINENDNVSLDSIKIELNSMKANQKIMILDSCRELKSRSTGQSFGNTLNQISEEKNTLIITSCRPNEVSYELNDQSNANGGIFTDVFVYGLAGYAFEKGKLTLMNLYSFLNFCVNQLTLDQYNDKQNPEIYYEGALSNLLTKTIGDAVLVEKLPFKNSEFEIPSYLSNILSKYKELNSKNGGL